MDIFHSATVRVMLILYFLCLLPSVMEGFPALANFSVLFIIQISFQICWKTKEY